MQYFITRLPDGDTSKFHGDTAREALLGWCRDTFAHEGRYAVVDSNTGRSRVYQVTTSVLYKLTPVNQTNADEAEATGAIEGTRNSRLVELARYFADQGVARELAMPQLLEFAAKCDPPLDLAHAEQVIDSFYRTVPMAAPEAV